VELYLHSNTSAWRDAQLSKRYVFMALGIVKHRDNFLKWNLDLSDFSSGKAVITHHPHRTWVYYV
jgi:hypothetical protein